MSCFFIYNERSMKINLRIVFFRLKAYGAGLVLFVLAMVLSSVTALHAQNGTGAAELVRAFEDALRAPDGQGGPSVQGVAEGSWEHGPFEEAGQDIPEVTRTDEAIPPNPSEDPVYGISEGSRIDGIGGTMRIESPSGPQAVEGRTDAVQTDGMQELARLLERVGGGNASATELYQLQFLVGMLRVQATGGAKLSQQVNQGFESLLKQQG